MTWATTLIDPLVTWSRGRWGEAMGGRARSGRGVRGEGARRREGARVGARLEEDVLCRDAVADESGEVRSEGGLRLLVEVGDGAS